MATVNINDIELVRRGSNVRVKRKGRPVTLARFFETAGFSDAIADIEIDRTMDGASTLVLSVVDPNGTIAELEEFQNQKSIYPTEIRLGKHWFALAGLSKTSDGMLSITFENREVNAMRRYAAPRKAKRARITRAEFCRTLVNETTIVTERSGVAGRIDFVSPESKLRQIIGVEGQTAKAALAGYSGFPAGIRLKYVRRTFTEVTKDKKVVGVKWKNETRIANKTQLNYYDKVFKGCLDQKAPRVVYQAAALLALSGSNLWNTNDTPGRPPGNLFGLPRRGKWNVSAGTDAPLTLKKLIPVVVRELKRHAKASPKASPTELVRKVSGRSAGTTKPWLASALEAERQWVGGANRTTDAYEFTRGAPSGSDGENTWEAITRMAGEVQWRCWCDEGVVYFVSEDYLISRPATLNLSERLDGVNGIEWSQEGGVVNAECTVSVLSEAFDIAPGATVAIKGEGPADGPWIVKSVSQSVFSLEASVTLSRGQPRLAEPKGEIGAQAVASLSKAADNTVPASIEAMIGRANKIDGGTYLMGGNGGGRYDCSSAVSQLLNAGGYLSGRVTTVQLNVFGASGRGKYFTVYSEGGGGANGHCWLVFEKASGIEKTFEYHGPQGARGGWNGPPRRSGMGSKNVRHVRGL